MKFKMLALATLSSAVLLSGSAFAEDSTGSKTYTFVFGGTIDSELGVTLNNAQDTALSAVTQVPFYYSEKGVFLDGPSTHPILSATTMKDFKIKTNDSNSSFDLRMRNSKPMTYDDGLGDGPVVCTNQCGNLHGAWFSGWTEFMAYPIDGTAEIVVKGIRAGEQFKQFNLIHERNNPSTAFAKGTYSEEWQLVITPSI
ncbi:hypothetical protein AB2327_15360 [Vibrio cholerae]|uniref:hypothetical protein n=1 Tax=Vibrio cholerae TaxID=666 RepID=UPI003F9E1F22